MKPGATRTDSARAGFAVLAVLFVLLALLVLSAPFVMAARNASRASSELSQGAQLRLALDSASRYARAELAQSHPAADTTPYSDSLEELAAAVNLDPAAFTTLDERGVMWDLQARDAAAKIDLNSASPQVVANLLGASTRLARAATAEDKELAVSGAAGLADRGALWIGGELVRFGKREGSTLQELTRGLGAQSDADGRPLDCGPQPPLAHEPGTVVLDQRAFAPAQFRLGGEQGTLRRFRATEELALCADLALEGLSQADRLVLAEHGSVWAGERAKAQWQRPVRLTKPLAAGRSCELAVDQSRGFAPGSTLEIDDGQTRELALVQSVSASGLRLYAAVANDYQPFVTTLRVLARVPVNLNSAEAPVLVALFANLQLAGRNSRITRDEAQSLANLVIESRPFDGFEDFLERVVLPAGGLEPLPPDAPVAPAALREGGALLDSPEDAAALYLNGLNANDNRLAYSTMPYAFVSRDVHQLELRGAVNAPSGAVQALAARDEVVACVPQRELLQVWTRQEDFEEETRLCAESPWWASGPRSLTRWDGGAVPPTRFWPQFGTAGGAPFAPWASTSAEPGADETPPVVEHVFPSREEDAWVQLWADRVADVGPRRGRIVHFDHETRDSEGRWLPDQVERLKLDDKRVEWLNKLLLLRPFSFSFWFKLRTVEDGLLLDLGNGTLETDRVTIGLEGPDLVVRVYDAAGDHPLSTDLIEVGEARIAIDPKTSTVSAAAGGGGLPADTWMHLFVDVRGTRPDQITALVDGRAMGVRTSGYTRLSAAVGESAGVLPVESLEGFPLAGVARVGDELIEFTRSGAGNALIAQRNDLGPMAGFGGRLAREEFELSSTAGAAPGVNTALLKTTSHAAGTPVQLYGYSLPLASFLPSTSSQLQAEIGPFRVGFVRQVYLANSNSPSFGEPITIQTPFGPYTVGLGIEGANSQVSALVLGDADDAQANAPSPDVMRAFDQGGGYAALIQVQSTATTSNGTPIGQLEIVRYSGVDVTSGRLLLAERGVLGTADQSLSNGVQPNWQPKAWVVQFQNLLTPYNEQLHYKIFVVPISIRTPGVSATGGFADPSSSGLGSEFAQLTRPSDPRFTEWVRYDQILFEHLVRNEFYALLRLREVLLEVLDPYDPTPPSQGGGGGGGGAGVPPGPLGGAAWAAGGLAPVTTAQAASAEQWLPTQGEREDEDWPVARAAAGALQFRGVMGTFSHKHPVGTLVLPVFRVFKEGVDSGRPGRLDRAFLVTDDPGSAVRFPVTVHRAYIPRHYELVPFTGGQTGLTVTSTAPIAPPLAEVGFQAAGHVFVALEQPSPAPFFPTQSSVAELGSDARLRNRLVLHPSGELPRRVLDVTIGGSQEGELVPSATVDELVFGTPKLGQATQIGENARGGQLRLVQAAGSGQLDLRVAPSTLRTALGLYSEPTEFLQELPEDGGLLRLGDEIVAYSGRDPQTGVIEIAPGGRGLLGTEPAPHEIGEMVTALESFVVTTLAANISGDDAVLPVASVADFHHMGTLLLGDELIHYTHNRETTLEMPRRSAVPGARDGRGGGVFRGRFGTQASAHNAGTPVIEFPFRYWDRWADRYEGAELAYFGFELDQPGALVRSVRFALEEPASGQSRIELLQRIDQGPSVPVPWDGDPGTTKGLTLLAQGDKGGAPYAVGEITARAQWRAFVRYAPGAFDALGGASHGWKETPRLVRLAVEYAAPEQVLHRLQR